MHTPSLNKRIINPFNFTFVEFKSVKFQTFYNIQIELTLKEFDPQQHNENIDGGKAKQYNTYFRQLVMSLAHIFTNVIVFDG